MEKADAAVTADAVAEIASTSKHKKYLDDT